MTQCCGVTQNSLTVLSHSSRLPVHPGFSRSSKSRENNALGNSVLLKKVWSVVTIMLKYFLSSLLSSIYIRSRLVTRKYHLYPKSPEYCAKVNQGAQMWGSESFVGVTRGRRVFAPMAAFGRSCFERRGGVQDVK